MNVPTAKHEATTPKTSDTDTATPAASTTAPRIDDFIKAQFAKSTAESFSGIKSSADRLARLGFRSSANSRYADFLEAFRSTPLRSARYAELYPNCCFLPWPAFHAVLKTLDLWCDLPEFYAGAVPEEQIPWMEIFELRLTDQPEYMDFPAILGFDDAEVRELEGSRRGRFMRAAWYGDTADPEFGNSNRLVRVTHELLKPMRESFFVVAPKEAFTTTKDYITRLRKMVSATTSPTVAPNDPLVIRFVNGGALVVAAWGDEAAELNAITRELGI
jgi:hypothetical protein